MSAADDKPADAPAADASQALASIEAEALALETAAAPAAPGVPAAAAAPAADNTAAELLGALQMARMMVAPMFQWWPAFGDTWSDAQLQGIAEGGALVMQRHGWTMGGVMGEFGPYLALAGATLPPSFVTYQAIKAHKEAQERAARERREPSKD